VRPSSWLLVSTLVVGSIPVAASAQTTESRCVRRTGHPRLRRQRKYQDAIHNLEEALKREPDHVEALYYMGVVNMALRRPEQPSRT